MIIEKKEDFFKSLFSNVIESPEVEYCQNMIKILHCASGSLMQGKQILANELEVVKLLKENVSRLETCEMELRTAVFKVKTDDEKVSLRGEIQDFKNMVMEEMQRCEDERTEEDEFIGELRDSLQEDQDEIEYDIEYTNGLPNGVCKDFLNSQIVFSQLLFNESCSLLGNLEKCRDDLSPLIQKLKMLQDRIDKYEEYFVKSSGSKNGPERIVTYDSRNVWKVCPKCGSLVKKLSRHMKRAHNSRKGVDTSPVDVPIARQSTRQMPKCKSYKCPYCELSFHKKRELDDHIDLVHPCLTIPIRGMNSTEAEEMKRRDIANRRREDEMREKIQRMTAKGGYGKLS